MDESHSWRAMFERRQERPPESGHGTPPANQPRPPLGGYDDGYDAAQQGGTPPLPQEVVDEAALALADDPREYRPWILQRGRSRPVASLHLRRFDPSSGMWKGWVVPYPFVAAEYLGDNMLSLDFGARVFMLEGGGFGELVDHLQSGLVQCVQEYSEAAWRSPPHGAAVKRIQLIMHQGG